MGDVAGVSLWPNGEALRIYQRTDPLILLTASLLRISITAYFLASSDVAATIRILRLSVRPIV